MNKRRLGNTGLLVGEVGMGCEGFLEKTPGEVSAMIGLMEERGCNCIDLYTPNPEMRTSLGQALRGRRDRFILQAHLCTIWKDGQYKRTREIGEVKAGFVDLLTRMELSSVEIGMIHYVDSMADWDEVYNGPVMRYAQQLKADGVIEHIGLSSHNPAVARKAVESGLIEVLMFSVNPCYDLQPANEDLELLWAEQSYEKPLVNMDPEREALYEVCQRMGVGITVMKAFGGGDLLDETLSPAGRALTPYQCMNYALTRPAVASVIAGARTLDELRDCLSYSDAPQERRDYAAALAAFPKISWQGHCMYCGHCAPCPKGIDVASVTKFLNLCKAQGGIPETVREHYAALPQRASACVACGACEKRCPFGVPIIENMKSAAKLFGK